jgi:hypothetical protein
MAVHREKLAAAKLTLPSGLKHAATTRLFKTMRTRGSVADNDEDVRVDPLNSVAFACCFPDFDLNFCILGREWSKWIISCAN